DWSYYKVPKIAPIALVTHICSPKIPYKSVGKEAVADRPEIERELVIAIREAARQLKLYLSKIEKKKMTIKRLNVYAKYLPIIVKCSAELAGKKIPDISKLLAQIGIDEKTLRETHEKIMKEVEEKYIISE
ncbi:MAG: DNA topoisomerase VI subunit B, partial [Nitrososphaerota archaeon]